jgi:hypothetical protein
MTKEEACAAHNHRNPSECQAGLCEVCWAQLEYADAQASFEAAASREGYFTAALQHLLMEKAISRMARAMEYGRQKAMNQRAAIEHAATERSRARAQR